MKHIHNPCVVLFSALLGCGSQSRTCEELYTCMQADSGLSDSPASDALLDSHASSEMEGPPDSSTDSQLEAGNPFTCEHYVTIPGPLVAFSPGSPPVPTGGPLTDGKYLLTRVTFFRTNTYDSISHEIFEIRSGYIHVHHDVYGAMDAAIAGSELIGTYVTNGPAMALNVQACNIAFYGPVLWTYSSAPGRFLRFDQTNSYSWIEEFELQAP